tara:strand:+ start:342 stop:1262 length:921 start_codon:yes stop_codon:yes gene_type:complete
MKVLFVCSGNKTKNKPGVVVQNQANTLIKKGISVNFYLIKNKGFIGYITAIIPLVVQINKGNYSVIHAHYSLSGYLAGIAKLFTRKTKLIVSLMGSDTQGSRIKLNLIHAFAKYIWDETIVKSQSMIKNIEFKNVNIIPNGVDLDTIVGDPKLKNRNSTILFPANPSRISKNHPLAKASVALLGDEHAGLKVMYNRPHSEIIDALKNCGCVLLTSKWEGSPNIIKEAMACNTPIVATRVGDVEQLLDGLDGCFLTQSDVDSVSKAIKKALLYSQEHVHTKGRDRLIDLQITSDLIAGKIIKLYEPS